MADPNCWSRTFGTQRGARVRVYERVPGGVLQISVWLPVSGESRRSLGHRDRERAIREARTLIKLRQAGAASPDEHSCVLTLGVLFARYIAEGKYLADGSLKTDPYLRHIATAGRNLASHFGENLPVVDLTPSRLNEYVRYRREGRITGSPVRTNAIQRELTILKGALNWARGVYDGREPLLPHHPLEGFRIPSERDPKRPVVSDITVAALLAVADEVHPYLRTLIVLARTTGRRLSAILGLRWEDIDFVNGTIRWRAEHDKLRKTWVVPVARAALEELTRFRAVYPGVGQAQVFPHPSRRRHREGAATRHLAAYWLKRAYELSRATKPDGSLWHAFRRLWATERKALPVKDVAAAGGWKDVTTLINCYQQPDEATLRSVVEFTPPGQNVRGRKARA
jgi:integrase